MKKYISPEIEAVLLNSADCITASVTGDPVALMDGDYANDRDNISFDNFFVEW